VGQPAAPDFCDRSRTSRAIESKAVDGFEKCLRPRPSSPGTTNGRAVRARAQPDEASEYRSRRSQAEAGYVSTTMSPTPVVSELSETVSKSSKGK